MSTGAGRLIPREVFFGNPAQTSPALSPDGTRLAYLAPWHGVLNIWEGALNGGEYRAVTRDGDRGIRQYQWAQDGRHLLYLQDSGGNENWRLHAVDLATGTDRDLTPFDGVQVQLVDTHRDFPGEVLIAMNREDRQFHDVYRLTLDSGQLLLEVKNPGNVAGSGYLVDAGFQVRGAWASTPDAGSELLLRDTAGSPWRVVARWDADDSLGSRPVGFSRCGDYLYLLDSRQADTAQLVKLHASSLDLEVLASDPQYDLARVELEPHTRKVQAVMAMRERAHWQVLDAQVARDFANLSRLHSGDFRIVSRNRDDSTWLVAFSIDDGPISYFSYQRRTGEGQLLFVDKPDLLEYELCAMEPVAFPARDGLTIHGYLTYPRGGPRTGLPLVLRVHGGPWSRDGWGFHPEVQWLANRGYACLQPNFRGSTGYGKAFVNAGDREWGAKMHDDLVDAVGWAVQQGIADPARVAIFGASYGGYAALAGATFTPHLFACAVDVVGPSNLVTLLQTTPPYWASMRAMLFRRVGNPKTEPEFLMSRSPLSRVDQIRVPMLIAQGANDPRVKRDESEQIVAAMKAKDIYHEYLLFPDEGHGFAKPENRLVFYKAAERFLARYLGGSFEE